MATPKLQLIPPRNPHAQLIKAFDAGKPLSAEQHHFLNWHYAQLSSPHLDPLLRYYRAPRASFLLPANTVLTPTIIAHFKKRLALMLHHVAHGVEVKLTPPQFQALKTLTGDALIFYHGNHYLTGALFFPGGVAHVDYFQWGNLYGVVKYEFLMGETEVEGNILVYFEDMEERLLEECVKDYERKHTIEQEPYFPPPIPAYSPRPLELPRPSLILRR